MLLITTNIVGAIVTTMIVLIFRCKGGRLSGNDIFGLYASLCLFLVFILAICGTPDSPFRNFLNWKL